MSSTRDTTTATLGGDEMNFDAIEDEDDEDLEDEDDDEDDDDEEMEDDFPDIGFNLVFCCKFSYSN